MIKIIDLNSPDSLADYGKRAAIDLIKELLGDGYSGIFEEPEVQKFMKDVVNAPFLMQAMFVYIDNELVDVLIIDPCGMMVKPECDMIYRDKWLMGFFSDYVKTEKLGLSEREKEALRPYNNKLRCIVKVETIWTHNVLYLSPKNFKCLCARNNYNLTKWDMDSPIVKDCASPFMDAMLSICEINLKMSVCLGRKASQSPFFPYLKKEDEWYLVSLIKIDEIIFD